MRTSLILAVLAGGLALAVPGLSARPAKPAPVAKLKVAPFGHVLVTRHRQALYRWSVEQKAHRILCTGTCLQKWPPLVVAKGTRIAAHRKGFKGRFGTVRRPDGRLQVTYRGAPLYSYIGDPVATVLCDNEDGWFVMRA